MLGCPSAVAAGIISGATLQEARALWQRGREAGGQRAMAVNGQYPAAGVPAGRILVPGEGTAEVRPLTVASLQNAGYLTFSGHGGARYLAFSGDTDFRAAGVPPLGPIVVATSSCNTFRLWERGSIALAFTRQGGGGLRGLLLQPQ